MSVLAEDGLATKLLIEEWTDTWNVRSTSGSLDATMLRNSETTALSFKPLSAHWEDEQVLTDLLTSARVSRSTLRSCLAMRVSNELRRTATTAHAMFLLPNILAT